MARKKVYTVSMDKIYADMLELYSETTNNTRKLIIETFISEGIKYDIVKANWTEALRRDLEIEREKDEARSGCQALALSVNLEKKKDYRCVWYRVDKPPQIRKLGNTKKMQKAACLACGRTGEIVSKLKERDTRIVELETQLGEKSAERFKIPKCNMGADLRHDKDDQLVFYNCRKHSHAPVSIEKFCKVYSNRLPCASFAQVTVGVSS